MTSSGTERARYLGLPTANVQFPHRPGYLAVGVVRAGDRPGLEPDTIVAVRGAPHGSLAVVPPSAVEAVPPGVAAADAALWQLGLTAMHGLAIGAHRPGERVAVLGSGLLGVVTRRIAAASGSSVLAVARSRAREWTTRVEPDTVFVTAEEMADEAAARRPLVLDVTGDPAGLTTAVATASDGGRIVLLGSPRALRAPVPALALHDHALTVAGAHVRTAATDAADRFTDRYFALLAAGRLRFEDVLEHYPPERAAEAYRRLVDDPAFVAAAFEWDAAR